jgi:hypothetical protein
MTSDIESELRSAFARRAAQVPATAVTRLCATDFRPRTSRLRPPLTVGVVSGVAAAGTVATMVVLGGAQPAFAGWSATPTSAAGAGGTTVGAACQARLAQLPPSPGSVAPGAWTTVVTDVRGPFSVVVFQSGDTDATCFTGPSFTDVDRNAANGDSVSASGSVSDGAAGFHGRSVSSVGTMISVAGREGSTGVTELSVSHLSLAGDGAYTLVEGRISADVTGLTFVRSAGDDVEATIGSGWFVAWWPGSAGVSAAQVTTPGGDTTQALTEPSPPGRPCTVGSPTSSPVVCTGAGPAGSPAPPPPPGSSATGSSGSGPSSASASGGTP